MKHTLLLLLLMPAVAFAGGFSSLTVGARSVALGGSLAAFADDPNVLFSNPSGIAGLSSLSVATSYSQLFPGISGDQLQLMAASAAANLGFIGTIGVGVKSFSSNGWNEQELTGAYGLALTDQIMVGGSAKLLHWASAAPSGDPKWTASEPGLSSSVLSFDAGVQFVLADVIPQNDLRAGIMVGDINMPSIASDGSEDGKLPMRVNVSVGYVSRTYDYSVVALLTKAGDLRRLGLGSEVLVAKSEIAGVPYALTFRGSVVQANLQGDINGGLGLLIGPFGLDYAYGAPTELQYAGGTHHLTLRYTF